ncbi:Fatty-acid amide hydrolase 1 [Orchesella cincta]|uniref:Fatty-acid amide hydrolase 1 n=1 Tax=Orchesella cincta TaxID=48709 RepID=A0A1D2MB73_ORCCI|nr:Fatty-acid amide hydrolase 1 [Orchesella cincta]
MRDNADSDPEMKLKIQKRQQERMEQIAQLKTENVLDEVALKIVKLPVLELLEQLQSRKLTATQVLKAYTAKALELTQRVNCVTQFIPQAPEWAANLDGLDEVQGPLHGLPIAVKEDHDIKGMDTTMCNAKLLFKPQKEHAVIVKILLKMGAVPFCKTNLPQSMFSPASENPIYGQTTNGNMLPDDTNAGTGCIVGGGAAPIGIGSDMAGSVRIPADYHGLCSLKPTRNRLSGKGIGQAHESDDESQLGVSGFITKSAGLLTTVMKALLENNIQHELDFTAAPVPWNETLFSCKDRLRIGYFVSLPIFPSFPDVQKTVMDAKLALESAGHELVPFQMPDDFHHMKTNYALFAANKGSEFLKMFEGEPLSASVLGLADTYRNPRNLWKAGDCHHRRRSLSRAARRGMEEKEKSADDLWAIILDKIDITLDLLACMDEAGIDCILSPPFPFPAIKNMDNPSEFMDAFVYTVIWNFLDFPAGGVRFGIETGANIEDYDDEDEPTFQLAKELVRDSVGMPINVQIAARPFKEELVLRVLVELEKLRDGGK